MPNEYKINLKLIAKENINQGLRLNKYMKHKIMSLKK